MWRGQGDQTSTALLLETLTRTAETARPSADARPALTDSPLRGHGCPPNAAIPADFDSLGRVGQREFISKRTRIAFREFLVGWTLREIGDEFSAAGIEPDLSHHPRLSGQRREYVEQHYYTVDFANPMEVGRVISVYEAILGECETDLANPGPHTDPATLKREYDKLIGCLRRDGFELRDGRLRAKGGGSLLQHLSTSDATLNADYLALQVERLTEAVEQDSDLAIGQAKELVETCCKTILANSGESDYDRLKLVPLVKKTMKCLQLVPEDIPESAKGIKTIKAVLGNLAMISQGMAELRNLYGTGHGRHGAHKRLPLRHARLAVGAASTLTVFLFETYSERASQAQALPEDRQR